MFGVFHLRHSSGGGGVDGDHCRTDLTNFIYYTFMSQINPAHSYYTFLKNNFNIFAPSKPKFSNLFPSLQLKFCRHLRPPNQKNQKVTKSEVLPNL